MSRLKIDKNKTAERLDRYRIEKTDYPINYYKQINKYFDLKHNDKIENYEYEILGKLMDEELMQTNLIKTTDNHEFLDHLNVPLDEFSKRKRLKLFEDELKVNYSDNLNPIDYEKLIRAYFDLKDEKLNANELKRLEKLMKKELLAKKCAIQTDADSKERRVKDHSSIASKLIKNKPLDNDDISDYFDFSNLMKKTSTKEDLTHLSDMLKNEVIDQKVIENQKILMDEKQIPTDKANKHKRYNQFKTDLLVNYEVGKVKYFIGKYFDKAPDELNDEDINNLFRIIKTEIYREMDKEPEKKQEDIQRTLNLMNNEIKILKEQKDTESALKDPSIKLDKQSIAERIKRFNDTILSDYKSGVKKLNYQNRIEIYFNTNLNNISSNEIEKLGRLMDKELKDHGLHFVDTDNQFLQDKKVDPNDAKRDERIKKHNLDKEKLKENLKHLDTKKIVGKYYDMDSNDLNGDDLIHFSTMMVDEVLNKEGGDQTKLERAKQALVQRGIDPLEREKRRLKFKNEIEPELRSYIKKVDYSYLIAKYFDVDYLNNLNSQEIALLKRLMDKEIRQKDKKSLDDKYKINFEAKACNERLKRFKTSIEPDYKNNLKKLNYQDRIVLYFNLDANRLQKEDLERLGKQMEDELVQYGEQFPSDDDLYLIDLDIPIGIADKKKRLLKLQNELDSNPVESTNPFHLLKVYFDLKDLNELNEKNLKRLPKIIEEEQIQLNGNLILNQLKNKTDQEKLLALLELLQLSDINKLKSSNRRLSLSREGQDKGKNLNEEVSRLEQENNAKIEEMRSILDKKSKSNQDDALIENLKKDLDNQMKQQSDLKLDTHKSITDDPDEQQRLLDKLAQQKKNLEDERNARLKEEADKLRQETEERYKKKMDSLEEEEQQREQTDLEELERAKNQLREKHKKERLERKKRLQEGMII